MQAYDAICEIARELQGSTVPPGTKPAQRLTSELPATDAFNTIIDVARELRRSAPPAVFPPASRSSDAPAAYRGGRGGWRFGNINNNNQSSNGGNSDQRHEGNSRKAQSTAKSE